ncbi:MAG: branched-chain amino acid transaminase [Pseudomonadota bacterium]
MSPLLSGLADRDGVIWINGELVDWRDARVHVLTHTFHYGVGVFEGVRAYATPAGTRIFRLVDHTQRLFNSAKILRMELPFDAATLNAAQAQVIRDNGLDEGYLRPMAFLGSEGMGLRAEGLSVNVMIAAWPWPSYMAPEAQELGIRMQTSSYTRHHVNITMCKAKANGNYINSILALREAIDSGVDEALLLDNEGYVAEGTGENIFLVKGDTLHTPELTSCLAGITRDTVIALAADAGLSVVERRITRDEVYIADEVFLTGTAAEVLPVREVDGRTIGGGGRGPVTERLQADYFDLVRGHATDKHGWLAAV